jgi:hypothetical protein
MRHWLWLIPVTFQVVVGTAEAAKTISIVGRVVTSGGHSVAGATVVLAIGTKDKDRIVNDPTNDEGLFHLVKFPAGQFTELYVWIEEPYSHRPIKVAAIDADVLRSKLRQITVSRTKSGPLKKAEAADRMSTIFEIEQRKVELGISEPAAAQKVFEEQAKGLLARCDDVTNPAMLRELVTDARNKLSDSDREKFVMVVEGWANNLHSDQSFLQLATGEREKFEDLARFMPAYMRGETKLDAKRITYISGLDSNLFKPEWLATDVASQSLWKHCRPTDATVPQGIIYLGANGGNPDGTFTWNPAHVLAVDAKTPPSRSAISQWVELNPAGGKFVFKIHALNDSSLSESMKAQLKTDFKGFDAVVIPADKGK